MLSQQDAEQKQNQTKNHTQNQASFFLAFCTLPAVLSQRLRQFKLGSTLCFACLNGDAALVRCLRAAGVCSLLRAVAADAAAPGSRMCVCCGEKREVCILYDLIFF